MKYLLMLFAVVVLFSSSLFAQATASLPITWTAVGDDSLSGTASQYDLRWSTDSTALVNNFLSATRVTLVPAPKQPGGIETFTITGLPSNTLLFFAIKTADEVPNWSGMSNILRWRSPDLTPPAAIKDLRLQ